MPIKNLKYDLTPTEIFNIFLRDYDRYTKEEINELLLFLLDISNEYVKADNLILLRNLINTSCKNSYNGAYFKSYDLDIFVNKLTKFLFESTNINVNEPVIIDENVYLNYLNYLGNDGKMFSTRMENDYIFNSCIHSRIGVFTILADSNISGIISNMNLTPGLLDFFYNIEDIDFDTFYVRQLPIYLEFRGNNDVLYGWVNNPNFSRVAGIFLPLPLAEENNDNILLRDRLDIRKSYEFGVHSFYDFSKRTIVEGNYFYNHYSSQNIMGTMSGIIKDDYVFLLNCRLPDYIYKCYKDEGGIFERDYYKYQRDDIITSQDFKEEFKVTTEYNPIEGDKSYLATPKFGNSFSWNLNGIVFPNDKDFLQVIKKEDIKYQGDLEWKKNNFYMSNFVYIPEIYIFILNLYVSKLNSETVKRFRILCEELESGDVDINFFINFIAKAYLFDYNNEILDVTNEEVQLLFQLNDNGSGSGIIDFLNYYENNATEIADLPIISQGFSFLSNLKNVNTLKYNLQESDQTFTIDVSFWNPFLNDFLNDEAVNIPYREFDTIEFYYLEDIETFRTCFFYANEENGETVIRFVSMYRNDRLFSIKEYSILPTASTLNTIVFVKTTNLRYSNLEFSEIPVNYQYLQNILDRITYSLKYKYLRMFKDNDYDYGFRISDSNTELEYSLYEILLNDVIDISLEGVGVLDSSDYNNLPSISLSSIDEDDNVLTFDEITSTKTFNKLIFKKNEYQTINQDIEDVSIEMLENSFYDWDKVPFYIYKCRIGNVSNAEVKSDFLTRMIQEIKSDYFVNANYIGQITDEEIEDEEVIQ